MTEVANEDADVSTSTITEFLSLQIDMLGHIAESLPPDDRLAFSLAARALNAARITAKLKLKTKPKALMYSSVTLSLWAQSIGCPLPKNVTWELKLDDLHDGLEALNVVERDDGSLTLGACYTPVKKMCARMVRLGKKEAGFMVDITLGGAVPPDSSMLSQAYSWLPTHSFSYWQGGWEALSSPERSVSALKLSEETAALLFWRWKESSEIMTRYQDELPLRQPQDKPQPVGLYLAVRGPIDQVIELHRNYRWAQMNIDDNTWWSTQVSGHSLEPFQGWLNNNQKF